MSTAEDISADESTVTDINPNQYVTFIVGEECFAVDMTPVQEIIRVPEVVRVPLSPHALLGLSNLRGKVLPILSLRHLFGFENIDTNEATRAVVVDVGQPLGFVVDRVSSVIEVDPDQIESTENIKTSIDTRVLRGVIKQSEKDHMIMILDFELLIEHEFSFLNDHSNESALTDGIIADEKTDETIEDIMQLVSFSLQAQEYAIDINDVKEIVQVPEQITALPQSAPHILGLINLRGQLLPLIDLRILFDLVNQDLDEKSRIVVLAFGGYRIGIVVDAVSEVLRVPQSAVEGLVPFMAREAELSDITDICRLDDGKRLVSILSVEQLFGDDTLKESLDDLSEDVMLSEPDNDAVEDNDESTDDNQVVVFRLDGEEFAVPITSIQEIVRIPEELIHVPKAPDYLEGVINLRGIVLPVVDLRVRLGMEATERSERQRIVVFMIHGVRTGFIVDQVSEVLKIPEGCVEPSPKIVGENGDIFSGMANIQEQERMIQLIEPDALIDDSEASELGQVSDTE